MSKSMQVTAELGKVSKFTSLNFAVPMFILWSKFLLIRIGVANLLIICVNTCSLQNFNSMIQRHLSSLPRDSYHPPK
jgi:hypothetical protein